MEIMMIYFSFSAEEEEDDENKVFPTKDHYNAAAAAAAAADVVANVVVDAVLADYDDAVAWFSMSLSSLSLILASSNNRT